LIDGAFFITMTQMRPDLRSDEELIQAYLAGENTAFDRVVDRYQTRLVQFALRFLKNYGDAEDVVHETWLKAWQNIRTFEVTRKFSSWLYKICQNECLMELRRRKKRPVPYGKVDEVNPSEDQ